MGDQRAYLEQVYREHEIFRGEADREIRMLKEELQRTSNIVSDVDAQRVIEEHQSAKVVVPVVADYILQPNVGNTQAHVNVSSAKLTPLEAQIHSTMAENQRLHSLISELESELRRTSGNGMSVQNMVSKLSTDIETIKRTPQPVQPLNTRLLETDLQEAQYRNRTIREQLAQAERERDQLLLRLDTSTRLLMSSPPQAPGMGNSTAFEIEDHIAYLEDEIKLATKENSTLQEDNRKLVEDLKNFNQTLQSERQKALTLSSSPVSIRNMNVTTPLPPVVGLDQNLGRMVMEYENNIIPNLQRQIKIKEGIINNLERIRIEDEEASTDLHRQELENVELLRQLTLSTKRSEAKTIREAELERAVLSLQAELDLLNAQTV